MRLLEAAISCSDEINFGVTLAEARPQVRKKKRPGSFVLRFPMLVPSLSRANGYRVYNAGVFISCVQDLVGNLEVLADLTRGSLDARQGTDDELEGPLAFIIEHADEQSAAGSSQAVEQHSRSAISCSPSLTKPG
eukprot:COSAG06_NODE_23543_length_688_cov_1.687606_1_plen_134_part_10